MREKWVPEKKLGPTSSNGNGKIWVFEKRKKKKEKKNQECGIFDFATAEILPEDFS